MWWGAVTLPANGTVNVPLSVSGSIKFVDGALWWPEGAGQYAAIDLALVDPNGVTRATSVSSSSDFERVRATTGLAAGMWNLKISSSFVQSAQTVYFYAYNQH